MEWGSGVYYSIVIIGELNYKKAPVTIKASVMYFSGSAVEGFVSYQGARLTSQAEISNKRAFMVRKGFLFEQIYKGNYKGLV